MITCAACGYDKNPNDAQYCDTCGSELQTVAAPTYNSSVAPTLIQPAIIEPHIPTLPIPLPIPPFPTTLTAAKLISKQPNSPVAEFPLDSNAVVGIFRSRHGAS